MEWRDEGILLSVRRHGEANAIIEVFTSEHGRHPGIVRGGASRKQAPYLQPGAQLDVIWRARLEEHLGTYGVEPLRSRAAQVMQDRSAMAGLNALCGLLCFALPERDPHPALYARTEALFDRLGTDPAWPLDYVAWELALLEEMGFGLDLGSCAVTGASQDLAFVSPRTGRAVSRAGAGEWVDKLLPLPDVLRGVGDGSLKGLGDAMRVTGHFLSHWLAAEMGDTPIPASRQRLAQMLAQSEARAHGDD